MPLRVQTDVKEVEAVLHDILSTALPPVARCRMLSSGFSAGHTLDVVENLAGIKACLGCGNCIDICPVLAREPKRREKTEQRTSMALENLVAEDCDRCYACVMSCPQVDTTVKHYIVNRRMVEVMSRIQERIGDVGEPDLDLFLEEAVSGS
ncbi:MAG: 4Fe-4S dicluster domain-containing protein [Dehalococcoidales bacterium]|nr:4Fe-4S dicluster domain-containing protein [Dehalococcoidales bacterium]